MRCVRELTGFIAIALSLDCGDANPTVQGGDPTYVDPVMAACSNGGAHSGNRWQDLYYCYFGPTGVASCGGQGSACHGTPNGLGVSASDFVCAPSPDPTPCWGKLNATIGGPGLYVTICKSNGGGTMPKGCTYVFQPSDLARIQAWIQQGAPDN
jgi:hypothetical protein